MNRIHRFNRIYAPQVAVAAAAAAYSRLRDVGLLWEGGKSPPSRTTSTILHLSRSLSLSLSRSLYLCVVKSQRSVRKAVLLTAAA